MHFKALRVLNLVMAVSPNVRVLKYNIASILTKRSTVIYTHAWYLVRMQPSSPPTYRANGISEASFGPW